MNIREYIKNDRAAITDLTMRAWKPVFEGLEKSMDPDIYEIFVPDWQAEQLRSLKAVCETEDIAMIVAELGDKVVGFSAISFHPEDYLGQVYMIGVDPDHQKQGIGIALMNESLQIIKRAGFQLAMVETGGDPGHASARAIYEKLGFQRYAVARYLKRI